MLDISVTNNNSGKGLLNIIKLLSSIAAVICCILATVRVEIYYPLWVIPVIYSVSLLLVPRNINFLAPGIVTLNIVMFFRYAIMPIAIYWYGRTCGFANNYNYMNQAIILMIYELISIMITIELTGRNQKYVISNKNTGILGFDLTTQNRNTIFMVAIVLTIVFLTYNYRTLTGGFSLIINGTISTELNSAKSVSGIVGMLWQASLAWLYIYFCNRTSMAANGFAKTTVVSLVYILSTFIGQSSISRWYTMISFIAVFFTLIKFYPNKMKRIVLWILAPTLVLIMVATLYKNTAYLEGVSFVSSFKTIFLSNTMSSYFAGPVNVNNAIGVIKNKDVGLLAIFYDFTNNMPIINHFVQTENSSANIYNQYIGRAFNGVSGDQIIPLIGQSAAYFSYIFAPLLSVLSVVLIRKCDIRFATTNTLKIYAFAFTGAWLGVSIVLNLTIFMSWVYIRIIPLFLMIIASEIINNKGKIIISPKRGN